MLPWRTVGGSGSWEPLALQPARIPTASVFSELSWLGPPDRFELVKGLRMASAGDGEALTPAAVDACVRDLEEADARCAEDRFDDADAALRRVLAAAPNCTLALYRWGALALLREASVGKGASAAAAAAGVGCTGPGDARIALRSAVRLEASNRGLRDAVMLLLRLRSGAPCPAALFDLAAVPRSAGDVAVVLALAERRPDVAESLADLRRADTAAAISARRQAPGAAP